MSVEALENCLENVVLLDVEELSVVAQLIGDLSGVLRDTALIEDVGEVTLIKHRALAKWESKKEGRKWWMKKVTGVNLAKGNGFAIEGHLVSGPDMVEAGEAVVVGWKNGKGENRCVAAVKAHTHDRKWGMDVSVGTASTDSETGKVGGIEGFRRLTWDDDGVWFCKFEEGGEAFEIVLRPELERKTRMRPDLRATIQVLSEMDGVLIKGQDK